MKRMFAIVYEILQEIGQARAAQRINQGRWDY
jgi:hypothetical protein